VIEDLDRNSNIAAKIGKKLMIRKLLITQTGVFSKLILISAKMICGLHRVVV
jgi:hypothetical protein